MRGIRVLGVPHNVEEKHLKIYFSKKENNGGAIESIYYPLTNNDAVITFKGAEVVNRLLEIDHTLKSSPLKIHRLPENMVFTSLEAKLSSDVSALIIATPDLHDQIRYVEDIDIINTETETQEESADQTLCFRGNWFQLERAWHMLDCIMQQQSHFAQPGDGMSNARSLKQSYPTNRPLKKSDVQNRAAGKQLCRRPEQLGIDMYNKVETGFINPDQSDQVPGSKPIDSLEHNKSAFYGTFVKTDRDNHKMPPENLTTELKRDSKQRRNKDSIVKLKKSSVFRTYQDDPRPACSSAYQTESKKKSLAGSEMNGLHSSLMLNVNDVKPCTKPQKYRDENDTFEKFSSIRSDQKVRESSRRQNSEHSSAFSGAYGTEDYKRRLSDSREDPYFSPLPVDLNDVKPSSHAENVDDILKKYSFRQSESYTKHGLNSSVPN